MKTLFDLREKKLRPLFQYLLIALVSVALVLLGLEVFLRAFVFGPGPKYVFDSELGKIYAAGTSVFRATEGRGLTRYVANGEIATPYSGGESLVVLGDSHTEAYQVNDDEKFVSVAERSLRQKGYEVDLHNLVVSGARIANYVYMSNYVNRHYSPKVLVVQVTEEDFTPQESFRPARASYFVALADGTLVIKHKPPVDDSRSRLSIIPQSSALVNYGRYRLDQIRTLMAPPVSQAQVASASEAAASPASGVDTVKLELQALRRAYPDIPIVILALPHVPRVEGGRIVSQDPQYVALLESIRGAGGFYLVDPLPAFLDLIAQGKLPRGFANTSPGDGHMNVDGHQIVGAALAQQLEEVLR
jgi:lysophospholipase L1-like esterase